MPRPQIRALGGGAGSSGFAAGFKQDATLLATVGRRWCETASHGCQPPFLHVGFDVHEAHLSEVDVHSTWTMRTDGREEVLGFQAMSNIIKLLAVACEEHG